MPSKSFASLYNNFFTDSSLQRDNRPDIYSILWFVTDWMYLVENGTVINRSQFRKFGVKVAELVATMRQREPA